MNISTRTNNVFHKFSSILDYPHPGLDPNVWDSDGQLLPKHKEAILSRLNQNLENAGLKHFEDWYKSIHIVGSLTTYQYTSASDCDIHIYVDFPKFIESEKAGASAKEAEDFLDGLRKEFFSDPSFVLPGTKHPAEFYFVTPKSSDDTTRVGIYDVQEDKWIKDPVKISMDFDIEESKPKFVEDAAKLAGELDISLGDIKRQISKVEELQETIKAWDSKAKKLFKEKLDAKLEHIETEIQELIDIKTKMVQIRHTKEFDATSEDEIKFKYLQRFGYFYIITQLKDLLEVTEETIEVTEDVIPEIKEIVTEPVKKAGLEDNHHNKLMIDFDKTIAENTPDREISDPMPGVKEAFDKLKSEGWNIIIYSGRANTPEGADEIREFMKKHDIPYDEIFIGKPIAEYYIDDRNIVFTDWKDVVDTIGHSKTKKKASIGDVRVWIDTRGKVIPLDDGETHDGWARRNVEKSLYELIAAGWVRIGDSYEDASSFNIELSNKKQIPEYIDDFIASNYKGGNIEVEDNVGTVEISSPFPNLQNAVNQAIVRQRMVAKTAQHNVEYDYSSTHFVLPKDIAQKIVEWSVENIPNENLYDDDTKRYGRELESHITVLFGLLTNDSKDVEKILKDEKPVRVKFKKTKVFENDMDAIFIEVDSEDIDRLHKKLSELDNEDQQPDYHPHCTVAYVESGLGKEYAGVDILDGLELELDTVKFSPKDGDPVFITLGGGNKKEASDQVIPINNWGAITKNPTADDAEELLTHSSYMELRWGATDNGDLYIWNASSFTHHAAASYLGLNFGRANSNSGFLETVEVARDMANKFEDARYSKTDKRRKAATLIEVPRHGKIVKVYKNPTLDEAELCFNESEEPSVRYYMDVNGNIYLWDAFAAEHAEIVRSMGHDYSYSDNTGIFTKLDQVINLTEDYWNRAAEHEYWMKRDREEMKNKTSSVNIVAYFMEKKAKLHWFTPGDAPHVVDPGQFELTQEAYEEYLNKGYIAIDDQSSPPKVLVWDVEMIPDWLNQYLNDKVGYGYVTIMDRGGRERPVHIPTKDIKRQILRDLYAPEEKAAAFMPSIVQAPDNPWQGDSDVEIPLDPDTVSDEETWEGGEHADKPRKGIWQKILDFFKEDKTASTEKTASAARGWLDPNGKFYNFGNFSYSNWEGVTHDDWAKTNETMLHDQYNIDLYEDENPTSQLIEHGWIRISDDHRKLGVHLLSLKDIPDFIESHLLSTMGADTPVTLEDADGTWVEVTNWHSGLQRAVNKELQRKKMIQRQTPMAASLNKEALDFKYWISPQGEYFKVHGIHIDWIRNNWHDLGFDKLYETEGTPDGEYLLDQAYDYMIEEQGWARVTIGDSSVQFMVTVWDINKMPASVEPFVEQFFDPNIQKGVWFNDYSGNNALVDDPIGNIQEKIVYELRHRLDNKPKQREQRVAVLLKHADVLPDIIKLVRETGGATWNFSKGNLSGTENYAVSIYPEHSVVLDHEPTIQDLNNYIQSKADLLQSPDNSLGIWNNGGKYYLDISLTISDREKAIELGKKHNQISIFDLKNFQEIPTGGTGEVQSKQAMLDQKYWVAPDGEFIPLKGETHPGWIQTHSKDPRLAKFVDIYDSHLLLQDAWNIIPGMLEAGWVRVTNDMGGFQFCIEVKDLHNLPSVADNIIDKFFDPNEDPHQIGVEDLTSVFIVVTDPFPSLQQAVNEFLHPLRQKQVATLGLSKHANFETTAFSAHAWWIAPDKQVYEVRGKETGKDITHAEWIENNRTMLRQKYKISLPKDLSSEESFDINSILIERGWTRIGDYHGSQVGIRTLDIHNIPSIVEDVLASFATDGSMIHVEDVYQNDWATVKYPFKSLQREVNRFMQDLEQKNKPQNDIPISEPPQPVDQKPESVGLPLSSKSQDLEPFKPLPTTFEWGTNDENLNSRYPWKFMKKPTGPNYSNEDEVNEMLMEEGKAEMPLSKRAFSQFGFWVAPDGKAYNAREGGARTHGEWVLRNAPLLQKQYGIVDAKKRDYFDVAREMLEKGWARIGDTSRARGMVGVEVASIKNLPSYIDNTLATFMEDGQPIIVADLSDNYAEVMWPFKSLQQEVRRTFNRRGSLQKEAVEQQDVVDFYLMSLLPPEEISGKNVDPEHYDGFRIFQNIVLSLREEYIRRGMFELKDEAETTQWVKGIPEDDFPEELKPYYEYHDSGYSGNYSGDPDREDEYEYPYSCENCSEGLDDDSAYSFNESTYCDSCYDDVLAKALKEEAFYCTDDHKFVVPKIIQDDALGSLDAADTLEDGEHNGHNLVSYEQGLDIDKDFQENQKKQLQFQFESRRKIRLQKHAGEGRYVGGAGGAWYEAPDNFSEYSAFDFYKIFKFAPWKHQYGGPLWAEVARTIHEMQNTTDLQKLVVLIDHFHDLGHNTGKLLDKFEEWHQWFKKLLDMKAQKNSLNYLLQRASTPVRKLVMDYIRVHKQHWRDEEPAMAAGLSKRDVTKVAVGTVKNVLIVCSGNTCRSPMAENILRSIRPDLNVVSRGLYVPSGGKTAPFVEQVLKEKNIPYQLHTSTQVTEADVAQADIIFVMETWQVEDLMDLFPQAQGKTFLMGDLDIADPIGGELKDYQKVRDLLELALQRMSASQDKIINTYKYAGNLSNTYTDDEMEQIYDEQHAEDLPGGDGSGGNVYHDWNRSTTDYPKPEDTERKQKINLDLLEPTQTPPIGSYEVTWFFGQPRSD
jgi:protein-tyrosine phosphatase